MIATATSFWITGIDARRIDVEAHVESGTAPAFAVVGLADRAVQEARQRVRSGIKSASYRFPSVRVTVNLAPARERKQGSGFDLAIALAILAASGQVESAAVGRVGAAAELGLDGRLRPIQGTIAIAEAAGRDLTGCRWPPRTPLRPTWPRRFRCSRPTTSTRRCRSLPGRRIPRRCPP